jgi:hypothetical protein
MAFESLVHSEIAPFEHFSGIASGAAKDRTNGCHQKRQNNQTGDFKQGQCEIERMD